MELLARHLHWLIDRVVSDDPTTRFWGASQFVGELVSLVMGLAIVKFTAQTIVAWKKTVRENKRRLLVQQQDEERTIGPLAQAILNAMEVEKAELYRDNDTGPYQIFYNKKLRIKPLPDSCGTLEIWLHDTAYTYRKMDTTIAGFTTYEREAINKLAREHLEVVQLRISRKMVEHYLGKLPKKV